MSTPALTDATPSSPRTRWPSAPATYTTTEAVRAAGVNYHTSLWYLRRDFLRLTRDRAIQGSPKRWRVRDVQALALLGELRRLNCPMRLLRRVLRAFSGAGQSGYLLLGADGNVRSVTLLHRSSTLLHLLETTTIVIDVQALCERVQRRLELAREAAA